MNGKSLLNGFPVLLAASNFTIIIVLFSKNVIRFVGEGEQCQCMLETNPSRPANSSCADKNLFQLLFHFFICTADGRSEMFPIWYQLQAPRNHDVINHNGIYIDFCIAPKMSDFHYQCRITSRNRCFQFSIDLEIEKWNFLQHATFWTSAIQDLHDFIILHDSDTEKFNPRDTWDLFMTKITLW